jgi:hypothetical protein
VDEYGFKIQNESMQIVDEYTKIKLEEYNNKN